MNIREKAEELKKYADLENDELSEFWMGLISTAYRADFASDEFAAALEKEIDDQLAYCKENATIVEKDQTYTRKVVSLEWA